MPYREKPTILIGIDKGRLRKSGDIIELIDGATRRGP